MCEIIDISTSDDMENMQLESRMYFRMNFTSDVFSSKTLVSIYTLVPRVYDRSFWPAAGIESSGSNHFEITKEIAEFCPSGLTRQSSSMAHARNGCSQSSGFLPQARRIVGSGDENGLYNKRENKESHYDQSGKKLGFFCSIDWR